MKIMVTGGLGFIGHNVVLKLMALGHDVAIIDNMNTYGEPQQHESQLILDQRRALVDTVPLYTAAVDHRSTVDYVIGKFSPEIIIHLASFPRQQTVARRPDLAARTMIEGLTNVLGSAKSHQVRRIVFISSSMVYGDFLDHCDESHQCVPIGQYGIMKLAGEQLVRDCARQHDIEYTIIRPSAVYGPRDSCDRVLAQFISAACRGGEIKIFGADEALDFTHVQDTAQGIVAAALSHQARDRVYNITRGHSVKLVRAAKIITELAGRGNISVLTRDTNTPSRGALNIDAARKDFGYDPQVNIQQGLEDYYHWFVNTFHRAP